MDVIIFSEGVDRVKIWRILVFQGFVERGEGYKVEKEIYEKN